MFTPGIGVMINWYADWHLGRASYASAWLPYRQLARPRFNIQTRRGDCRSSRFTTVLWNNQHCSQRTHRYSISVTSYYPCLLMQWNIYRPRRSRTRRSCPRPVPRWGTRAPCRRSCQWWRSSSSTSWTASADWRELFRSRSPSRAARRPAECWHCTQQLQRRAACFAPVTGAPKEFKFGVWVDRSQSHPADEKSSLNGAWSGSRDSF